MKKVIIRIILLCASIYLISIFFSQQKMLNSYAKEKAEYQKQIDQARAKQEELNETLENLNSTDYIEEIAREKLDMYLPNERVYIDITK